MKKALAARYMGPRTPFSLKEYLITQTPSGYGRMSLIASGICGTDLHFYHGTLSVPVGNIIGHEFVGRLEDCDETQAAKYGLKIGDAVVADIALPCGKCKLCQAGDDANCVNMGVTNGSDPETAPHFYGGFAQVNFTPLSNLIKVPESVDPTIAAIFACPGPTAVHALHLGMEAGLRPSETDFAVVQGLGPVGFFALLYLKHLGVKRVVAVTATSRPDRAALAMRLGADAVYALSEMGEEGVKSAILEQTDTLGADLCFEASGAPVALLQGMEYLRNRGVYLIPGQYSASGGVTVQPQLLTFKALRLIGSSQYSMEDVRTYLDVMAQIPHLHETIRALGSYYSVSEINKAIDDADHGRNIKTLLIP